MALRAISVVGLFAAVLATGMKPDATAVLKDSQGKEVGTATFQNFKKGVRIAIQVVGLSPGEHGVHIHAVGRCDPPDFNSAGGHFNPGNRQHGRLSPAGPHAGDLPNLVVGKDGIGKLTFADTKVTLGEGANSLLGPEGTSLIVHAGKDDEKTDPAGNSGGRIACGVIEKA